MCVTLPLPVIKSSSWWCDGLFLIRSSLYMIRFIWSAKASNTYISITILFLIQPACIGKILFNLSIDELIDKLGLSWVLKLAEAIFVEESHRQKR